jgi:hypothetical protein
MRALHSGKRIVYPVRLVNRTANWFKNYLNGEQNTAAGLGQNGYFLPVSERTLGTPPDDQHCRITVRGVETED